MRANDKVIFTDKNFRDGNLYGQIGELIHNYPLMTDMWIVRFDSEEVCVMERQLKLYKKKTRKCFK